MKKLFIFTAVMAMMPFLVAAQTIKSPNGDVTLTFCLDRGKAFYEMTYKGKTVVKKSRLGLELAKTKYSSKKEIGRASCRERV